MKDVGVGDARRLRREDGTPFTISVCGGGGVGKTCLVLRYTRGSYDNDYIPTIQDVFEKNFEVRAGVVMPVRIIDTAGQDEMRAITDIGIREADACVIVFAVNSPLSLNECDDYYQRIKACHGVGAKVVLAGNKCDVPERVVTPEEGQAVAARYGCRYFETSAKENIQVAEAFGQAVELILGPAPKARQEERHAKGERKDQDPMCCTLV